MINPKLLNPASIAVIGGSNDIRKPGGKVLKNLLEGQFVGPLYVVNPKETDIQGQATFSSVQELPKVDLAIIAIAAKFVLETVQILVSQKETGGFIILSAGFSEENEAGKLLEKQIVEILDKAGASLIGPNCIGVLRPEYHGVFTRPIPTLTAKGCDFISGSGATACFIMEAGIPKGLPFASVFSVGNSAQIGVEEILAYLDETYNPETSSSVKLLYIETITKPEMLLKSAQSLISKGCRIAAIKSGGSEAGSRAASSHTGALASNDAAVDALFKKAGIVRCNGREELIAVASVFMHPVLQGKQMAIITHAGGPAVMLTDALSNGGIKIPPIGKALAGDLLAELFPGSSVENPIDFLATGTAEQLGKIIDYVEEKLDFIDGMVVIFGTAGLSEVYDAYTMLHQKMNACSKPIFPVLPSIQTAHLEIQDFLSKGHIFFSDEVTLGNAIVKTVHTPQPETSFIPFDDFDIQAIRRVIENAEEGYLAPEQVQILLDAAGIPRAGEAVASTEKDLVASATQIGYPLVMKVVGPVHKSDVGGVVLGVKTEAQLIAEFHRMMKIQDTTAILLQPMLSGLELFAGVKQEDAFGHLVFCGLGGIFIEILKDVQINLAPFNHDVALSSIRALKSYGMIQGARGKAGVNEQLYAEVLVRLAQLTQVAPEIFEMDLNPLLGTPERITAVDARIRILK